MFSLCSRVALNCDQCCGLWRIVMKREGYTGAPEGEISDWLNSKRGWNHPHQLPIEGREVSQEVRRHATHFQLLSTWAHSLSRELFCFNLKYAFYTNIVFDFLYCHSISCTFIGVQVFRLHVISYGCQTWSLLLKKLGLRVTGENLDGNIWTRRYDVIENYRKIHNEEINNSKASPGIIRANKSKRKMYMGM